VLPKISIPTFDLKIPSISKTVVFRARTYAEEKILLTAKESGEDADIMRAVKQVVGNCCQDPTIDIEKVAIFDLEYLFLKIHARSVSNISKVTIKDAEDEQIYPIDIDLNSVEIDETNKKDSLIKITDDIGITLNYPPAAIYGDKEVKGSNDVFFEVVVKCIGKIYQGESQIDPKTVPVGELRKWLASLDTKTFDKIKAFYQGAPRLHYDIKYTNSKGKDQTITLSSLSDFFIF